MSKLPLNPVPSPEWQAEYDQLMKDPYLKKKYNREKRVAGKKEYIDNNTAEIKAVTAKNILDIGPGPGEWLEWCKYYGHYAYGIDAVVETGEMGYEYTRLSQMMTDRQKLNIKYDGLINHIIGGFDFENNSVYFINSQGSIEQAFAKYMDGPPHRETKKSGGLKWRTEDVDFKDMFIRMFEGFERILEPGGYIFIWGNGSKNDHEYDKLIKDTLKQIPNLKLIKQKSNRWHKFQKDVS